eukprot:TRINITY_DN5627_c0_g1_i4.p1 TRINITY_DN5627_c0_g1~~TRINITY_DN5627_c0_g1_i4.p1  ORF type:complete len:520 (+),score=160.10 TRINITY_DN5627_c0_g1_i4:72-1631(+)
MGNQTAKATSEFQKAKNYWWGINVPKDEHKALRKFLKASDLGCDGAMFFLGCMYIRGHFVPKDAAEAKRYFQMAAERGHALALVNLGSCWEFEREHQRALECYQKAADMGEPAGICCVGSCYYNGTCVERSLPLAMKYFKEAADMGDPTALFNMGVLHYTGEGLEKNHKEAVRYWQMASDKGEMLSTGNLGSCYYKGYGVAQDFEAARKLWEAAVLKGNNRSYNNIGMCFYEGKGAPQNFEKAVEYFTKAMEAQPSEIIGTYNIGVCYRLGNGVPMDLEKSESYLKKCETYDCNDVGHLGWCLEDGEGTLQNLPDAIRFYLLGAERGHMHAQYNLGRCYEEGIGVEKNNVLAHRWYSAAVNEGGHVQAEKRVQNLIPATFIRGAGNDPVFVPYKSPLQVENEEKSPPHSPSSSHALKRWNFDEISKMEILKQNSNQETYQAAIKGKTELYLVKAFLYDEISSGVLDSIYHHLYLKSRKSHSHVTCFQGYAIGSNQFLRKFQVDFKLNFKLKSFLNLKSS